MFEGCVIAFVQGSKCSSLCSLLQDMDCVLEVHLFHDDMSDERRAATIEAHLATFEAHSHNFVQSLFDGTSGLNVRTIEIMYTVAANGIRYATGARYIMSNMDIRNIPVSN